jgi:hypothetical protein
LGSYLNITAGGTDIALTANPFVDSASGNFVLNTTAGGGAAAKAVAFPSTLSDGLTTTYMDLGAYQSQCTGGASSSVFACGFSMNTSPTWPH